MKTKIQEPSHYDERMAEYKRKNPHARSWVVQIERKTNRHTDAWGRSHGWYELFPLGDTLGYWDHSHDDFRGFNRTAWNERASALAPEVGA